MSDILEKMAKAYDPKPIEDKWYASWTEKGLFKARPGGDKSSAFSIVIPPPNVTGSLHMDTPSTTLSRIFSAGTRE